MKLATEAPVNGGRNYEPIVVVKSGYMLEHLSIRWYSSAGNRLHHNEAIADSDNPTGAGNQQETKANHFRMARE